MKYTIHATWLLFLTLLYCASLSATSISMVYNLRIAHITRQKIANNKYETVALIFDRYQKKYSGIRQNFVGGMGSFIYNFKLGYFRVDGAISHIHEITDDITTFSGTETDDILFTLGHKFEINDRARLTCSGLFSVPTHRIVTLRHVGFGYGQVGTGIQVDGSCTLNHTTAFLYATRYVHFFRRTAQDSIGNKYLFGIGNLGDVLVACKKSWAKHSLEFGYNAFVDFGTSIFPALDDIVTANNLTRSIFYMVYEYTFFIKNVANRFIFNIACATDHTPKVYGNKYIVLPWMAWEVAF